MSLFKKSATIILCVAVISTALSGCTFIKPDNSEYITDVRQETFSENIADKESETKEEKIEELSVKRAVEIRLAFSRTSVFGLFAEFEENYIPENMTDDMLMYDFFKITNFNTLEEGLEYTKEFLTEEIISKCSNWQSQKENYFYDNENLVCKSAGRGVIAFDEESVTVEPTDRADTAKVCYDEFDNCGYVATNSFLAQYSDGKWRMSRRPVLSYRKSPAPQAGHIIW